MDELFAQIRAEIKFYEEETVEMNPPYAGTMPELLKLIDMYYQGRFLDGDVDETGAQRFFFNINRFRVLVSTKASDIDTKNLNLVSENGREIEAWFLAKELKLKLKEDAWGKKLNNMNKERWKYGHVVLKKVGNNIEVVPIQTLIFDPTAKSILKSSSLIERHDFTAEELRVEAKKLGWDMDEVKSAIEHFKTENMDTLPVFERYGEVNASIFDDEATGTVQARIITSEPIPNKEKDKEFTGFVFAKRQTNIRPYKESKLEEVPGRALGLGEVERRLDSQIRRNVIVQLRGRTLEWKALHIFQTRDVGAARNLLTDVMNGDILEVQSEITHINQSDNVDLAAYNQEENDWQMNDDRDSFSQDVLRGERPPSGTPLGSVVLAAQMAGGYFDLMREDLGLFLKEVFFDWVIPGFKATNNGEHIMNLMGDESDLERLDSLVINMRVKKRIVKHLKERKAFPQVEQIKLFQAIEAEKLKKNKGRYITIPAGTYENLKEKLDLLITGESVDVNAKLQTLQFIFQIVASNPAVLQDPQSRKILGKAMDLAGINPMEIFEPIKAGIPEASQRQGLERGGSISVPKISAGLNQGTQAI